jgi:hypothetical protein
MTITAPPLSEGTDFRRMAVSESGGVYRFKLLKCAIFTFRDAVLPVPQRLSFRCNGSEWMRIEPHRMILSRGYAWNGSSPKKGIRVFNKDVWIGTPDFDPGTLAASLAHDALFQFSGLYQMPFDLETANDFYEQICRANRFALTGIYREALDEFSYTHWGKSQPATTCNEI